MTEIETLIKDLFDDGSLGLISDNNPNGADSYFCPCCRKVKEIKGYAFGTEKLDFLQHDPDCKLAKLHALVKQLSNT